MATLEPGNSKGKVSKQDWDELKQNISDMGWDLGLQMFKFQESVKNMSKDQLHYFLLFTYKDLITMKQINCDMLLTSLGVQREKSNLDRAS